MSAENVALVRAVLPSPDVDLVELFRDEETWANLRRRIAEICHPALKTGLVGVGDGHIHDGLEGLRQTWLEWLAPWESYRAEIQKLVDCGENVLVLTDDFGRQRGMTAEVRLRGAAVWTVREARIAAAFFYAHREDALDAVGVDARAILGGE